MPRDLFFLVEPRTIIATLSSEEEEEPFSHDLCKQIQCIGSVFTKSIETCKLLC